MKVKHTAVILGIITVFVGLMVWAVMRENAETAKGVLPTMLEGFQVGT